MSSAETDARQGETPRLLAGLRQTGRPATLAEHLERYGALPPAAIRDGGDPQLVQLIEAAGLLGHGGAGFPTGRKMRTVASSGRSTVVVANGMEGEPSSSKDGLLLGVAPHLVLDGLQVAARAVGARRAHIVVHRGGSSAKTVRAALLERTPSPGLRISVDELPHHYVSSEESAVVHWLNGGEGKPLFVPPRPFERGVAGRPTLLNNVETLAHVALIARYGADWFRSVGSADEPGTLLVTVSGAVNDPGVVEVPTGTSVEEVIALVGGTSREPAALLVGGYFGTWLPAELAPTLPLTQHGLRAVGGALGAGIVLVLPASACGLAETAHVLTYLAAHNAGQCGPCVNGLPAIAGAMQQLAQGRGAPNPVHDLERWLDIVPGRGACRHPDGATRFAASALRVFAGHLDQHHNEGPCGAAFHHPLLPVGPPPATSWR